MKNMDAGVSDIQDTPSLFGADRGILGSAGHPAGHPVLPATLVDIPAGGSRVLGSVVGPVRAPGCI